MGGPKERYKKDENHPGERFFILFLIFSILLSACTQRVAGVDIPVLANLQGGILATFRVHNQMFRVWITNPNTIQQIFDLQTGKSRANIPEGSILLGPGENNYNSPYSWHLDPDNIEMSASVPDPACNVDPEQVETHLQNYVDQIRRYCPSAAILINVQDYRAPLPGRQTAMVTH